MRSERSPTSNWLPAPACPFPSGRSWSTVEHAGYARPARSVGADEAAWATRPSAASTAQAVPRAGRLTGMRILDLGVIVAGGELGRLFADLGAEVIKIESAAYPDGLRQTRAGPGDEQVVGVDPPQRVRPRPGSAAPGGRRAYSRGWSQDADAVFANFKPGTLASLGFSYERLRELNPASCSPRAVRSGPPARGANGWDTARWSAPPPASPGCGPPRTPPRGSFYDATTIFPDHVFGAGSPRSPRWPRSLAVDRTGTGAHVHISQAEAAVNQLATAYVAEAARAARTACGRRHRACTPFIPCDGDDEWCVISLRDDADRAALAADHAAATDDRATAVVSQWTTADKTAVAEQLQRAGVPAAPMNRAVDVLTDPQITLPKAVQRHDSSALRRADAHRDRPRAVSATSIRRASARADAR